MNLFVKNNCASYISTITIYVFCGNCPDQVKFVRGLSKLV